MSLNYPNPKVQQRIRQFGFRLTPQRELILQAVADCGEHATFDEIYNRVHGVAAHISRATVYRNLETFSRYRLIHGNEIAGGKIYELANDNGHHHLICQNCWKDTKLPDQQVRKLFKSLNEQTGFLVLGEHYIFMGLCRDCRKELGDSGQRFSVFPKFRLKPNSKGEKSK